MSDEFGPPRGGDHDLDQEAQFELLRETGNGASVENEEELLAEMFGPPSADGIYGAPEGERELMPGIDAMVREAEKTLGFKAPPTNAIQKWYDSSWGNFAWCDAAVTYWAHKSGNQIAVVFGPKGKFALTTEHATQFQKRGKWHTDVAGIRRGDIVFFDWGKTNTIDKIDHVGLVTSVSGKNVYTIEGNTDSKCARRVREASTIVGYGRPDYSNKPGRPPKYEPFPGALFFRTGKKSPVIAAMHKRLVAEGCDHYKTETDIDTWGSGDVASYAAWQRKCGFSGKDADGVPGETTWDKLQVPNV